MNYRIALLLATLLTACGGLQAPHVENTRLYVLDARPASNPARSDQVLAVSMPGAWPGFDTPQMAYMQHPLTLEYFATHRWADTPARLLRPLLSQSLEPLFRAVVLSPGLIPADLRLDTELFRLQQDFTVRPSRIQLVLRAQLTDVKNKRVIAVKLFDASENADSDDAYGGVIAANRALQRVLEQLADFCIVESGNK